MAKGGFPGLGLSVASEHLCFASRLLQLLPSEDLLVFTAEKSTDGQAGHLETGPARGMSGVFSQGSAPELQGHCGYCEAVRGLCRQGHRGRALGS